jgi:hypothetical protein
MILASALKKYGNVDLKPWEIDELPLDWQTAIGMLNSKLGDK